MKDMSIIFPCYNEERNIKPSYDATKEVLNELTKNWEILFVDDGSKDRTFLEIEKLNSKDKKIIGIQLAKNSGKAAALAAGFEKAEGAIVITMDADLQDDPHEIPLLVSKIMEGYDMVSGWKRTKHKGSLKRMPSKFFNWLTRKITKIKLHDFNCPFKAYKKEIIKEIQLYGEMHRYIPVLVANKGYSMTEVRVSNRPRKFGTTKYGTGRILKGLLDLVTIKYLTDYKSRPLHLFGTLGALFTLLGIIIGIYLTLIWTLGYGIGDRPLLMLAVLLVVIGVQFTSFGLIGEMIVKDRAETTKSYKIKKVIK